MNNCPEKQIIAQFEIDDDFNNYINRVHLEETHYRQMIDHMVLTKNDIPWGNLICEYMQKLKETSIEKRVIFDELYIMFSDTCKKDYPNASLNIDFNRKLVTIYDR